MDESESQKSFGNIHHSPVVESSLSSGLVPLVESSFAQSGSSSSETLENVVDDVELRLRRDCESLSVNSQNSRFVIN